MKLQYEVEGDEFINAGVASSKFKKVLKQLGIATEVVRKISIAMYEAEINMVIHAHGGNIFAEVSKDKITLKMVDEGPGIADITKAMQAGFSTASKEAREMGFGAGMGLPNIERYSDKLEVSSKVGVGTTLNLEFFLN